MKAFPDAVFDATARPRRLDEFDHPDSAWNLAAARCWQADPFSCRSEWQFSFHEAMRPRRPLFLRERGGSVTAFALTKRRGLGPVLEPLESLWLFGCPVLGPDAVELLASALDETHVRSLQPCVLVSGLRLRSALLRRLTKELGSRYEIRRLAGGVHCSASLEGGLDGFLGRRSAKLRKRLRQAAQRAAERGVSFERHVPGSLDEAAAVYARMLAVERASWKGIHHCGMAEPESLDFYGRLLRRLSVARAGRVIFARCGERDVGFVFGGLAGSSYRGQQFSYADDWAAFSIGNLLQLEQTRWLCEEGVARYDLGPPMEYKRHWTELTIRSGTRLLRPVRAA